jgi:hypothetical protein
MYRKLSCFSLPNSRAEEHVGSVSKRDHSCIFVVCVFFMLCDLCEGFLKRHETSSKNYTSSCNSIYTAAELSLMLAPDVSESFTRVLFKYEGL